MRQVGTNLPKVGQYNRAVVLDQIQLADGVSRVEIAQHTGLTTASVTSLIDRLESKGYVRRVRDKVDRRKVIVEPNQAEIAKLAQVFASLQGIFDDLTEGFSDEQLETIIEFSKRSAHRSQEAINRLREKAESRDNK